MLEARVDQVGQYEEKIVILSDELGKVKRVVDDNMRKTIEEIGKTNRDMAELKQSFQAHKESYTSTFDNNNFFMDEQKGLVRKLEGNIAQQK